VRPDAPTLRRLYGPDRAPFEPTRAWKLHGRFVHGLAVLSDGETFVSSAEDGTMVVASLADGRVVQPLVGHEGPVNSLCLTPDGARLVTGGDDHTVRIWDTRTWEAQHVLRKHTAYVREVAAGNAVAVSGGEDDTVRFWDLESGKSPRVEKGHREHLRTVAIAPDGRLAASSGLDNQLLLWDAARGKLARTLYDAKSTVVRTPGFSHLYIATGNDSGRGHHDAPRRLIFLDGGRTLASIGKDVIFWDVETGEEQRRWPLWGWPHEAAALHPDGRQLVLAGNGYVQVWDVAAGALVTTLGRGGAHISALAFSPDGTWLLAGTDKGEVQLWDFAAGLRADDGGPHGHSITCMVVHGRRALIGDTGGGVVLWDLEQPGPLRVLDVEREANGRPLALGEGVALTAESEGFAVWDADTGELKRRVQCNLSEYANTPHSLAPLADGRALVGFIGEGIAVYDLGDGEQRPLAGETQKISILAVSPDGRHAVSSGYFEREEDRARAARGKKKGEYVYVPSVSHLQGWDMETRTLLWTVAAGPDAEDSYVDFVFCLFTPDGRLVTRSGENERELAFWDPATGAVVQTVALPGDYPTAARVVGRDLVALVYDYAKKSDDGWSCTAVRIDLATGEITQQRELGRISVMTASFSADGSRLAVASLGTLAVHDPATGERVGRYECEANVRELSFTDDGRIVVGDQAGRVHVLALDGWQPAPAPSWTSEELAALQRETAAREPVRPAPSAAKKKRPPAKKRPSK
jgi:WD40 repeat protein